MRYVAAIGWFLLPFVVDAGIRAADARMRAWRGNVLFLAGAILAGLSLVRPASGTKEAPATELA